MKMDRSAAMANITPPRRPARGVLSRFARDEEGSLLILSIFIFLTMLVMTAMTLDFMRQEEVRQRVQNTADRAALAAADLNQTLDPKSVVDDYFAKEGLSDLDYSVIVNTNQSGSSRTVEIISRNELKRSFADFVAPNIKTLPVNVFSKAQESIGKVEISLVLDVSGSMNEIPKNSQTGESRIQRLKPAATAFVEQMFDVVQPEGAEEGRLVMSIIPYSTQVALNDAMRNAYTLSNDYSVINTNYRKEHCVDFLDSDFSTMAINPDTELQRTMLSDSWNHSRFLQSASDYKWRYNPYYDNCNPSAANEVLPYSNAESILTAKIASLTAGGNTSIDFGAKWGLALLDPSAKLAVTRMIANGDVKPIFAGRPTDYGADADTMKVLVLMTDGANTQAYSTKPAYRSGLSPIKSLSTDVTLDNMTTFVYYDATRTAAPYYNYSLQKWQAASDFKTAYTYTQACYNSKGKLTTCTYTGYKQAEMYDVTYETLYQTNVYRPSSSYSRKPLSLFGAAYFFGLPYGRSTTQQYALMADISENFVGTTVTQKNDNLHQICDLARQQGILVFTIAVDATTSGGVNFGDILAQCATTDSYAFSVDSNNLTNAFSTIIANINALRLTN